MKLNLKDILFAAIVGVLLLFLVDGCDAKRKLERQSLEILNYEDSVSFYKSKTGDLIAYNTALKVSSAEQIKGLEKELKELKLKEPEVVIRYKSKTMIDSIAIPIEIPCEDFTKEIDVDSAHYKIAINLTNESLLFKSILIPNEQSIFVAKKKERWWKASEYSVVVKNSNPYMQSLGLQSYTIKPNDKFYEKKWFWTALGAAGGFYVGYKLNN